MLCIVNFDEVPRPEAIYDCQGSVSHCFEFYYMNHYVTQEKGDEVEVTATSDYCVESTTAKFSYYVDYFKVKMCIGRHNDEPGEIKILIKVGATLEKVISFTNMTANVR